MATDGKHEALQQPIHPSMAGRLDTVFEKLYNDTLAKAPLKSIDLLELRARYSSLYRFATAPAPAVGRIYDDSIALEDGAQIPVRVYEPDTQGPWPVHVNYHGGGWSMGDLETEAHLCRHYCSGAGVVVVDVAYRLVPEFAFPTSLTDCFGALKHIHGGGGAQRFNVRPDSVSVGGLSAGGFVALAVAHLARDASIPLRLVAAGAPVIDDISQYETPAESPWPSMRENEFAPTLNWQRLKWFDKLRWSSLSAEGEEEEEEEEENKKQKLGWLANLLKAPNFEGLPRTLIFTAGADPLRDEGEGYAQLLVQNGVDVTQRRFPGVPHPFMHMDRELWQGREFIEQTAREIRRAHWG